MRSRTTIEIRSGAKKTLSNILFGFCAGLAISLALFGPVIMGWV